MTDSRRATFPYAAAITIAIIVIVEVGVWRHRAAFLDDVFPIMVDKVNKVEDGEARADVLVFGDSRSFYIRPKLVEEGLDHGYTASNLAWPLYGVDGYYYTLSGYLAYNPPPRIILANFFPSNIAMETQYLLLGDNKLLRSRAYLSLPRPTLFRLLLEDHRWKVFWDLTKYTLTPPTSAFRKGINGVLLSEITGNGWPARPEREARWIREYKEHGAFALFEDQKCTPETLTAYTKFFPLELNANPKVLARFEDFLRLAQENNIVVVLLNTPLPDVLVDAYEKNGILDAYTEVIADFAAKYPNLYLMDPVIRRFPNDQLADIGHLNTEGDAHFREILPGWLAENAPAIVDSTTAE